MPCAASEDLEELELQRRAGHLVKLLDQEFHIPVPQPPRGQRALETRDRRRMWTQCHIKHPLYGVVSNVLPHRIRPVMFDEHGGHLGNEWAFLSDQG